MTQAQRPQSYYADLLKQPLKLEGQVYTTIPKLKVALEDSLRKKGEKAKDDRVRNEACKRKADAHEQDEPREAPGRV